MLSLRSRHTTPEAHVDVLRDLIDTDLERLSERLRKRAKRGA